MPEPTLTVLTRDVAGNVAWRRQLEQHGAQVYELPCIETAVAEPTPEILAVFDNLRDYDWVIFTSPTGVRYFLELAEVLNIGLKSLTKSWIAAVGHQTADVIKSLGLVVNFVPSRQDAATLARELKKVKSRRVLFLRTAQGAREPIQILRGRSAHVTDLHIYQTRPVTDPDPQFAELLRTRAIARLVFASPSAVEGFIARTSDPVARALAQSLPAIAIGQTVATALEAGGFEDIHVAAQPSLGAILQLL